MDVPDTPKSADSELALFLESLAADGRAVVSHLPLKHVAEPAISVLRQTDEHARNELPLGAPHFSAGSALWAAQLFYNLCQFTACRDIGVERIVAACNVPCPESHGAHTDWSVDLTLRHLPRLFGFARHLSNADPLVLEMKRIASAWPLSSVGIAGLEQLQLDSFIGHPVLCRLYADRVLAACDISRLGDQRVDDFLRADIGIHRQLVPAIAARLFPATHDTN